MRNRIDKERGRDAAQGGSRKDKHKGVGRGGVLESFGSWASEIERDAGSSAATHGKAGAEGQDLWAERMAREEWAGTVLEWRHKGNHSLNGGKIVFHALFGGSRHSDQANSIFPSPFCKYLKFGMSTRPWQRRCHMPEYQQ